MLADPDIGGFTVTTVLDGTAQAIRLGLDEFLAGTRPDDLLFVYLSGHGLVDLRRRLYFAATDTRKDRLAATGVEAQWVLDQLDDCRARRQVVVLDCCFSGAFAARAKGDDDLGLGERFSGGRGRVVLTASRASEYSFEGKPVKGSAIPASVFTSALVDGLRTGRADLDGDGLISVDDAYGYVFDQVRAGDAQQTPQRWLYGAEGSITLARAVSGTAPPLPPPVGPAPPRRRPNRPMIGIAVLAAALVAGAAVFFFWPRSPDTGSAWRLVVEDRAAPGADEGCSVSLKNARTQEIPQIQGIYQDATFLLTDRGDWSWTTSSTGCKASALDGPGEIRSLPVSLSGGAGDSQPFRAGGPVKVEIANLGRGESVCHLNLKSVANGEDLDTDSLTAKGASTTLDPHGVSPVYLSFLYCGVRITGT